MKKILIATLFLVTTMFTSFAGTSREVDARTIASFEKDYPGARQASWQITSDFAKVSFELNGTILFAYYSNEGSLIATTRNLVTNQLPIRLFAQLKKDYNNHWVTDLFELNAQGTSEYFITLENGNETRILRSSDSGWELYDVKNK
jgi:hypothetical protein